MLLKFFLQNAFHDLAGPADGQFVAEFDESGIFIGGKLFLAPGEKFFFGNFRALVFDDKGFDLFAHPVSRNADHGDE